METNELKKILEAYDRKLDKNLKLNNTAIQNVNLEKSEKKTQTILVHRVIELVTFVLLAVFIGNYIATNWGQTHLVVSGIIVHLFTLIALIGSIGQVTLLQQIDFSKPIMEIRKKIELVNAHGLLFVKLIFLSAPIWWAYAIIAIDIFFDIDLFGHLEPSFVTRYLIVNALLIIPIIWLFNKLSYKNLHIKWVRKTIAFLSGTKTRKALEFLNDIEAFEKQS